MDVCDTPDLGRIKSVGLFLLDDCMAPIYADAAGYLDNCPANVEASDDIDDGDDFTRKCANQSIKRFIPGVRSLKSIEVSVDLHWLDPEWIAAAGGAAPIMFNGESVGWADGTNDRFNVLVVVWNEIQGANICGEDGACNDWVRMYPLKGAMLTEEGDIGSQDNVFRITGNTVDSAQLGSGPVPLFCDPDDGTASWPDDCFPTGQHRFRFIGAAAPDVCGSYDLEEPPDPCTPAS